MGNIECESCIKRKSLYCPNSSECYETENKPYWQNRIMLLEENNQLKEQRQELINWLEEEIKEYKYDRDSRYHYIKMLRMLKEVSNN